MLGSFKTALILAITAACVLSAASGANAQTLATGSNIDSTAVDGGNLYYMRHHVQVSNQIFDQVHHVNTATGEDKVIYSTPGTIDRGSIEAGGGRVAFTESASDPTAPAGDTEFLLSARSVDSDGSDAQTLALMRARGMADGGTCGEFQIDGVGADGEVYVATTTYTAASKFCVLRSYSVIGHHTDGSWTRLFKRAGRPARAIRGSVVQNGTLVVWHAHLFVTYKLGAKHPTTRSTARRTYIYRAGVDAAGRVVFETLVAPYRGRGYFKFLTYPSSGSNAIATLRTRYPHEMHVCGGRLLLSKAEFDGSQQQLRLYDESGVALASPFTPSTASPGASDPSCDAGSVAYVAQPQDPTGDESVAVVPLD